MLDSRILGQLLLMQSYIPSLPKETIPAFVQRGLSELPGVEAVHLHLADTISVDQDDIVFPITLRDNHHGVLLLKASDPEAFAPYSAYVQNFCFLLAVSLEERTQRQRVESYAAELERSVQDRTAQLNESMERYRALFLSVSDPVVVADRDTGILVECNEAAERYFGRSREQLIGLPQRELHPPDTSLVEGVTEEFKRVVTDSGLVQNIRFLTAGGIVRLADVSSSSFEIGESGLILGVFRDVTEQRQVEEALRKSEERYRESVELAVDGILQGSADGKIIGANSQMQKLLGRPLEQLLGVHVTELFDPEELKAKPLRFDLLNSNQLVVNERNLRRSDGTILPVEMHSKRMPDGTYQSIYRDITERKEAEEALRKSEERFILAMKASNDGLFDWNLETNEIYYSPAWKKILGYEDQELPNDFSFWENNTDSEDVKKSWELQQKLISRQLERFVFEFKMKHKKGHWVDILSRAEAIFNDNGQAIRIVGTHTDITERKRAERDLLQAKEAAEAANHSKSVFLANMSHEIRTPLSGMLGMLQLIQTSKDLKDVDMFAEMGYRSGQRLTSLLGDILDLSRIEAGRMPLASTPFALADIFTALAETFSPMSYRKGLPLTIKPSPDMPINVVGDEIRVRQILFNLVGNAMKFTDQGEVVVEISTLLPHPSGMSRLLFIVSDTGIGIPDEKVDQICAPFTQVCEDFTRSQQGAGLGLAIAHKLVEAMRGTLTYDSTLGEGTSVYLVLPFASPEQSTLPVTATRPHGVTSSSSLRLLLVEDDAICLMTARLTLEKMGHHVVTANNGAEALDALRESRFDCVLMDVQMGVLDGVEATRRIREGASGVLQTQIPIIAITAYAMTGDREKFLEAGMNDYVAKPVQVEELKKALNRVAERRGKG